MGALDVYFIRHNWNGPGIRELNTEFFQSREIAIHFDDFGLDESKYDRGGKTALRNMKSANEKSALVVATYRHGPDRILIGKSVPQSLRLENKLVSPELGSREHKILKLHDVIEIGLHDFSLPFLLQPPFSTMVHWEMGERAVNAFYENARSHNPNRFPIHPDFLTGWHWEVLCEEWLRQQGVLRFKLFQVGKFMKDFDIVGLTPKSEPLFVQVKFKGSEKDFKRFCQQGSSKAENQSAYYFDDEKNVAAFSKLKPDWVTLVAIQTVYQDFLAGNSDFLRSLLYGFHANLSR